MNEEKIKKGAKVLAFRICKGALYNAKEFMNKYQELILKEKKKITNEEIYNLYCQFALPTGIFSAGFVDEIRKRREGERVRPHCGKELE